MFLNSKSDDMDVPAIVKKLWDKYNLSEDVRKHCMKVAEIAMRIAKKIKANGHEIDEDAVLIGALLHDIGRSVTQDPFRHFLKSAEILKKEGFPEKIIKIAERHFSAGLSKEEAIKLGLPEKDYIPRTLEEKVVSFADNLTFGDEERKFEDFLKRLEEIDAKNPELRWLTRATINRAKAMKEEIEKLSGMRF